MAMVGGMLRRLNWCGSVGAWPGGCHVPRMRAVPQAARPELYLIVPCNVPKTVRVSEAKMAMVPFGYAKRC